MNIDRKLVARALTKAGEEPITDEEWEDADSNRVRIVKEFYLATLLESLSSYDWTSQKKRVRLEAMDNYEYEEVLNPVESDLSKYWEYVYNEHLEKYYYRKAETFVSGNTYYLRIDNNLTGYPYMYPLPADCAKVVKLANDEPYIIEGAFLFADVENAVLVYIRNYFTGTDYGENEDYNYYGEPELDPTLSAYFECKLAASLALKLTGGTDKYQMLYNEAELIANKAQKKSSEQAQNKTKGNPWWTDQLGM